jgi:hypothetical protein
VIFVTPAKTRRTRNRRGEGGRLRDEIIAAAARLIEENGQDAVSLRAVARSAGITAPSIYSHFEDLDDLLEAVIAHNFDALAANLRRGVEAHADPKSRLRGACHAYVAFGRDHPEQYAVLFTRKIELSPRSTRPSTTCWVPRPSPSCSTPSANASPPGNLSPAGRWRTPPRYGSRCTAMLACTRRYPISPGHPVAPFLTTSSTVSRC